MTASRPGESLSEMETALQQHQEWFCQMPWVTSSGHSTSIPLNTVRAWIDEYGSEFQATSAPLSASLPLGLCCHQILNLLSGPCRAFLQGVASRSVAYQRISEILQRASETSSTDSSLDDVRNTFRQFGRMTYHTQRERNVHSLSLEYAWFHDLGPHLTMYCQK